jgi:hypothetical protein
MEPGQLGKEGEANLRPVTNVNIQTLDETSDSQTAEVSNSLRSEHSAPPVTKPTPNIF